MGSVRTLRASAKKQFRIYSAMKLILAVFASLCSVAHVRSDEPPTCSCALFLSTTYEELMVYRLDEVQVDNCESHNQCKQQCTDELNEDTSELDLWAMMGDDTVGQAFCSKLAHYHHSWIHNKM